MRNSINTPGMGSPAANVIQSAVEPDCVGGVEASCGPAGRLNVPLSNGHSIGGSGVGVATSGRAAAAVGTGATGPGARGGAGVARRTAMACAGRPNQHASLPHAGPHLTAARTAVAYSGTRPMAVRQCGCGSAVKRGRAFVNNEHQLAWMNAGVLRR